jgi:hypothetical protein
MWIALAIMCQDVHDDEMPLMDCLAKICLAKRAAEKDPAVGTYNTFLILTDGKCFNVSDEGWQYLKSKAIPIQAAENLDFKESFLEDYSGFRSN